MSDLERTKYLRDLRRKMVDLFDIDELHTLAFDLSVDWGELSGDKKSTKSQSLIMYLAQRGRLRDLIILLNEKRPKEDWPEIPSPNQQIADEIAIIPDGVREAALQSYLQNMTQHVLSAKVDDASKIAAAKAFTSAVIPRLNSSRLAIVIRLLADSDLDMSCFDLRNLDLSNASLTEMKLDKVNFYQTNLEKAYLENSSLSKANMSFVNLSGAFLYAANLTSADLSFANLSRADLNNAILTQAKLNHAKFLEAEVQYVSFEKANLNGAQFQNADLRSVNLNNANLNKVNFNDTCLVNALINRVESKNATFQRSDLRKAQFIGANLTKSDFSEANLSEAHLSLSDFSEANMNGAIMSGAYINQTTRLTGAIYDSSTIWPQGFNPIEAGAVKID